jgi:hypothetical protein
LLRDPLLAETVRDQWPHLQANVHFLAGRSHFKEGQAWEARREILRAIIASPTRIKWANALVRMILPPAALRSVRKLRMLTREQNRQDVEPEKRTRE